MLIINLLILIVNFNDLIINLNGVHHNVGKNVAPTSIFYLSDDELHEPHQLGPNLRDRRERDVTWHD